jgi:hypothetical protein
MLEEEKGVLLLFSSGRERRHGEVQPISAWVLDSDNALQSVRPKADIFG